VIGQVGTTLRISEVISIFCLLDSPTTEVILLTIEIASEHEIIVENRKGII
jgi:hypothetical protein